MYYFWDWYLFFGTDVNHQDFDPSLLPKKFILIGMKQKENKFEKKSKIVDLKKTYRLSLIKLIQEPITEIFEKKNNEN